MSLVSVELLSSESLDEELRLPRLRLSCERAASPSGISGGLRGSDSEGSQLSRAAARAFELCCEERALDDADDEEDAFECACHLDMSRVS